MIAKPGKRRLYRWAPRLRPRCSLALALVSLLAIAPPARAEFGIRAFSVTAREANGTTDERAASRPFSLNIHLAMNTGPQGEPEGVLHEIHIDLPPGLLANPLAADRCQPSDFYRSIQQCAGSSQIGVFRGIVAGLGQITAPLYDLSPLPGSAATFGFLVNEEPFVERFALPAGGATGSTGLTIELPKDPAIIDVEEEIWGVPADPAHNSERTCWTAAEGLVQGCSAGVLEQPLLTLPASCKEPLRSTLTATSLGPLPASSTAIAFSLDAAGVPRPLVGCDAVPFEPRFQAATEAAAMAPTALRVEVEVPQHKTVGVLAAATVGAFHLELPAGFALNPASGAWLTGCSQAEIDAELGCSGSSRIGTVRLKTPFLDHMLSGAIFLATPLDNPFGSRYAFYLIVDDRVSGTTLKIPGRLEVNPDDGQLGVVIPALPTIPWELLELELGDPRTPLVSPRSCGKYSTEASFVPSSAPFTPTVSREFPLRVATGPQGGPCPPPEAQRNASPAFQAGPISPVAGSNSPLLFQLSREGTEQQFGSFELALPPGLVANLGSLPLGSVVGSAEVESGVGTQPLSLNGTVRLEGSYGDAPYSLAISIPAQAGPFDLGTITDRVSLSVDPVTAQVTARSDPLPQILGGVPLQLRGLRIDLDRPGFVRNPTSCGSTVITGSATSAIGKTAALSSRFDVANCRGLQFKPKAMLHFSGALSRNAHPAIRAVLRGSADEASIASARFSMPSGELLDLQHLRGFCTQGTAAAQCPGKSRLGHLILSSPVLSGPAEGAVYLVAPSHRLPELLAEVHSGPLRFVLHGRTVMRKGHFGVSFPSIPDIPLSRAVLSLDGGRRGLFVNSRSLCARAGRAEVSLGAHNGKHRQLRLRPQVAGC